MLHLVSPMPALLVARFMHPTHVTAVDTYSGYAFVFLACSASAKTTIHGLAECLIHHHGVASDQQTHFTAREVGQWVHNYGICHVLHHPEGAGLTERRSSLLETQL